MRLIGLAVALAVSLVLAPCSGDAQQPPTIPRLCYLTCAPSAPHDGAFLSGVQLRVRDVRNPDDLPGAFAAAVREGNPSTRDQGFPLEDLLETARWGLHPRLS
jgi:hypothetical protein